LSQSLQKVAKDRVKGRNRNSLKCKLEKFQISAVGFSIFMVCLAIYMMFVAFLLSATIALTGSHRSLLTIFITVVAALIPLLISLLTDQVVLQDLLHRFYYSLFLVFIYSSWWLPNKLSDLKRKHNL
jgi:hypothetical protein